jgi:histidyl-tRNA synthetase
VPPAVLRGFRDYPPPEAGARSELRRRMRAAARRCGFQELEVPSVELFELYQTKSGEGIAAQAWMFHDKGDRPVALIPETTPSLARVYVERAKSEPLPVKWFTISKMWRYEEPQTGRTREFTQFNLDILGIPGVEAEVDLLATASLVLDEVGAAGLYAFRISDRAISEGLGRLAGAEKPAPFFRAVDQFHKISAAEFTSELANAGVGADGARTLLELFTAAESGVAPPELDRYFDGLVARGLDARAQEGVARLRELFRLLARAGLGDRIVFDPTVVRGLAYYTSTVFEAYSRTEGGRSIFGGGRYDHLIELFEGPPTPVTGLAIGDQMLEVILKRAGRWPDGEPPLDTYVVVVDRAALPDAIALVQEIRASGLSADCDLLGRSMSRQFKEADRRKARRALILGLREAAPGAIVERDLASGAQREIPRSEAARSA